MRPYQENQTEENEYIRTFEDITDPTEFKWHRDLEDRIVEPIGETDWMVQLENQLPQKLEGRVFIPMKMWHRLIKGTGDLRIKLTKLKNNI